ncbi:MAG: Ferric siderophore transport system, periplasmic binding protein TonB [Rhodanobacteraceae bacterium]|jgi:beta-lactamase regulating signal transducer with metallopeptidase domain|nr:MAG: Ferric siderophore transport system, periplasmic binding protein TonB [Rhodanobacteraceae bacterium]
MMNNIELLVTAWCRVGWPLLLVFTVAVLVVAALRKPCRGAFGAECAFSLWLFPALAMAASLLPHAAVPMSSLPPLVVAITTLPGATAPGVVASGADDWRLWTAVLWFIGAILTLSLAVHAQIRYRMRLRGAVWYGTASRCPVLRAADPSVGPALVGAWRPCIVVPRDFDERYGDAERRLILAHEDMHARRRDGWWCLVAQLVAAAFWFHPLAWWALSALRRDQEFACDAGVLRKNRGQRRSYADAMLKTQSAACPLPVGCAWSPRHPLAERIAMLKQAQPGRVRRASGVVVAGVVILLGTGGAYAVAAPATGSSADRHVDGAAEYQLKMKVEAAQGKQESQDVHRFEVMMCQPPGKAARVSSRALAVEAIVTPLQGGRVRIVTTIFDSAGHKLAKPVLIGALGDPLRVTVGTTDATPRYTVDITPLAGCPAREAASHKPA